jgi:hypothetical protein
LEIPAAIRWTEAESILASNSHNQLQDGVLLLRVLAGTVDAHPDAFTLTSLSNRFQRDGTSDSD